MISFIVAVFLLIMLSFVAMLIHIEILDKRRRNAINDRMWWMTRHYRMK